MNGPKGASRVAFSKAQPGGIVILFQSLRYRRSDLYLTVYCGKLAELAQAPGLGPGWIGLQWSGSLAEAEDMVASIDVEHVAGDARGQIGAEEGAGIADLVDGDVAPQRRALFHLF